MRGYVLGLGPSLEEFFTNHHPTDEFTVGVNDIWKYYETDAVVCVDRKRVFNAERLKIIEGCAPKKFYSHCDEWCTHPSFEKINLHTRDCSRLEDKTRIPKSIDSTFIACVMAFHAGCREIIIYGADFYDHPNFGSPEKLQLIVEMYRRLAFAVGTRGGKLFVGSKRSFLAQVLTVSH